MRAIVVDAFGAVPSMADLAAPTPRADELLIAVKAAGLNPFDWQLADGALRDRMPNVWPFVLGNDAAGIVVGVGSDVTGHREGDRVFGQMFHAPLGEGTFADYTVVPAGGAIASLPETVSFETAAALPTAGLTALGLVDALAARPGATVLIVGASGGVGSFATRIAADRGFRVLATASGADAERVRGLGAERTFDHRSGELAALVGASDVGPLDAIVDLVGERSGSTALWPLVRSGGQVLSTVGTLDIAALRARGLEGRDFVVAADRRGLERLLALLVEGRLVVPIDTVIDLSDVPAAIARSRQGGARGKTVIRVA